MKQSRQDNNEDEEEEDKVFYPPPWDNLKARSRFIKRLINPIREALGCAYNESCLDAIKRLKDNQKS